MQGGVKIETFDLPNNDPAGGIQLTLETSITNVGYRQANRIVDVTWVLAIASWDATQLNLVRHVLR